jgi:hypothetical protein
VAALLWDLDDFQEAENGAGEGKNSQGLAVLGRSPPIMGFTCRTQSSLGSLGEDLTKHLSLYRWHFYFYNLVTHLKISIFSQNVRLKYKSQGMQKVIWLHHSWQGEEHRNICEINPVCSSLQRPILQEKRLAKPLPIRGSEFYPVKCPPVQSPKSE